MKYADSSKLNLLIQEDSKNLDMLIQEWEQAKMLEWCISVYAAKQADNNIKRSFWYLIAKIFLLR